MMFRSPSCLAALVFALLVGQITDQTTGQPLRGVRVDLRQGGAMLHAVTDANGQFRLTGVRTGVHTLHYGSDDVPPRTISVPVRNAKQEVHITACSTTLDYSCAGPGGGG
jgi:protocatechuate 3,4-dioxygenase beta subunit